MTDGLLVTQGERVLEELRQLREDIEDLRGLVDNLTADISLIPSAVEVADQVVAILDGDNDGGTSDMARARSALTTDEND